MATKAKRYLVVEAQNSTDSAFCVVPFTREFVNFVRRRLEAIKRAKFPPGLLGAEFFYSKLTWRFEVFDFGGLEVTGSDWVFLKEVGLNGDAHEGVTTAKFSKDGVWFAFSPEYYAEIWETPLLSRDLFESLTEPDTLLFTFKQTP